MVKYNILTDREVKIIDRRIKGLSLTQNESNILSKFVRPKLREIKKINANVLLKKIEYNQAGRSIENKIKKLLLENLGNIVAILLYGSAIQTNYKDYNDIDVLIVTKNSNWGSKGDKYNLISKLTEIAKKIGLNLDIQLIDRNSFMVSYTSNPSLIYQLKDSKIIYGKINIPSKIELSKLDLRMKLDWSDVDDEYSSGSEIYQSLRNVILVKLILNKIIDNNHLRESVSKEVGEDIINKLRSNTASKIEKKLVLKYIKNLSEKTDKNIRESKWEKIVL